MRGVFMEKIVKFSKARRSRLPVLVIVVALLAVAAIAVGVYFILNSGREKEPSRGIYVIKRVSNSCFTDTNHKEIYVSQKKEGVRLEEINH